MVSFELTAGNPPQTQRVQSIRSSVCPPASELTPLPSTIWSVTLWLHRWPDLSVALKIDRPISPFTATNTAKVLSHRANLKHDGSTLTHANIGESRNV